MTDDHGHPVQVERLGPSCYLASGWFGGVGRYATGLSARGALLRWARRRFLPLRVREEESDG